MPCDCSFPMQPRLYRSSPGVYKWLRQDFSLKQESELCENWMAFCYAETTENKSSDKHKGPLEILEHIEFR